MIINQKGISIPPYFSTSWDHIASLHMKGGQLIVSMKDGEAISIPNLSKETIEMIFLTHAKFLESENPFSTQMPIQKKGGGLPFHFALGTPDNLVTALQHQPEHKYAPDLPEEILSKITAITKIIAPQDAEIFPKAEPHCNCMHCQLARAFHKEKESEEDIDCLLEEIKEVSKEDLVFSDWEIVQTGERLYTVVNRLNSQEKYSVYLGHPVGCTCGKPDCEHIIAVLRS